MSRASLRLTLNLSRKVGSYYHRKYNSYEWIGPLFRSQLESLLGSGVFNSDGMLEIILPNYLLISI